MTAAMTGTAARLAHAARWRLRRASTPLRRLLRGLRALAGRRRIAALARQHDDLLARLRSEADARVPGEEPLRLLAVGTWSFPAYSQSFVYQELAALLAAGLEVRLAHTSVGPPAALPPPCAALAARALRLPGERAITRRDLAHFREHRPAATARLLAMVATASGRTEAELLDDEHLLRAFSFARLAEAWGADFVHSYFFYEGSLAAFVAQQLLEVPRGVTCYTDHRLADYRMKLLAPQLAAADLVVATSERAREELVALCPPCAPRVLVKANSVDSRFFVPVERADPAEGAPFRLLSVARLDPKKGLDDLVAAAAELRSRGVPFVLEHLGGAESGADDGEAELARLHSEIDRRGLGREVRLGGFVSAEGVRAALASAHLFVAPYVETANGDKDGLPTAVLEAMATGLPVVATRAGAITEAIVDGEDGCLVAPGDPVALAAAIAALLARPALRQKLGAAAVAKVRERFSVEACEPALAARIREIVAAPPPRAARVRDGKSEDRVAALPPEPVPCRHRADPYDWYDELRSRAAVQRLDDGSWILTRYEDVAAALRDPRLRRGDTSAGEPWRPAGADWLRQLADRAASAEGRLETLGLSSLWLINLDPPAHAPLRGLCGHGLGPAAVERLRPQVARLCDDLLDAVADRAAFDLMAALALPLPVSLMAGLLGVAASDREWIAGRARDLSFALSRSLSDDGDPKAMEKGVAATLELATFFRDLLVRPAGLSPGSILERLRDAGLDEPTAVAQALMFLFAGTETTANWIGNGALALLAERDRWAELAGRPDSPPGRLATALEELLRHDSPVQYTLRHCGEALEIAGQPIAAGDRLVLALAAANRDPARFPEPARIDLGRSPNPHLAFGGGAHVCLGSALARLEASVAFAVLLARFPGMTLAPEPPLRRPGALLRGLATLPVSPGPVAPRSAGR